MELMDFNRRSQDIFRQIVETYLETGDPVGSRTVSRSEGIEVSPATVRNVMADLADAGLLNAPHTSAGRIPTDLGLRLFVDGLMEVGNLSKAERASIQASCKTSGRTMDSMIEEASRALSGLSHCASLVVVKKENRRFRHIEMVPLDGRRALVILVAEDGEVENRLIDLPVGLPPSSLLQASNYLNSRLSGQTFESGRTLEDVETMIKADLESHQTELDSLTRSVIKDGIASWTKNSDGDENLLVFGQSNLLENVRAEKDLERLRQLFAELERKKDLVKMLHLARSGEGVRIFIGSENKLFSLSGSSLIVSPYMKEGKDVVGMIGVIGPTRLNYARIIPMVDYTAKVISRLM